MYEFEAYNEATHETRTVWGYNWEDAKKRHRLGDGWEYLGCEYVD